MTPAFALVADGLSFPTSLTFAGDGSAYVGESGLPFGGSPPGGRVWRLDEHGDASLLVDGLRPPVTGLTWHAGELYISEGGHPAAISRLDERGSLTPVVTALPGPGNYHVNMVAVGPDERLYFSQGAATNLGIVGLDAYELGWLQTLPHAHDIPGYPLELTGVNASTPDPTQAAPDAHTTTGAFVPFGTATTPGQRVEARVPCTAALLRCKPNGSNIELVAWGLRNAFAIGFLPDARLLAIDQGADDRGSRAVSNAPDALFEVRPGAWYGWPDFIAGDPITDPRFHPARGPVPQFLLRNHGELPAPERPLVAFPPHASAVKFDVAPPASALAGQLVVALFGDEAPMTAASGVRAGRSLAIVDIEQRTVRPIAEGVFARPIDVRFHPRSHALHVLDFGTFEMTEQGVRAEPRTGRLWRLDRTEDLA